MPEPTADGTQGQEDCPLVLLTEGAVPDHTALRVAQLHDGQQVRAHVVVPVDTDHGKVLESLDEVLLGRLRDAASDSGDADPDDARLVAQHLLDESVRALAAVGVQAQGEIAPDDPVAATAEAARRTGALEVMVVTSPHLVEEAFHRDWASRLRKQVDLPVLHAVAGTDRVVS